MSFLRQIRARADPYALMWTQPLVWVIAANFVDRKWTIPVLITMFLMMVICRIRAHRKGHTYTILYLWGVGFTILLCIPFIVGAGIMEFLIGYLRR